MKRNIIKINEDLCNGCGLCVTGCSEGALQIVNGKAKLVREDFCDGFGDCMGDCPTGALIIEERDAPDFDEPAVKQHLLTTQGPQAVNKMVLAQNRHAQKHTPPSGCPGMRMMHKQQESEDKPVSANVLPQVMRSELRQWPVQLHLVNPLAPYFQNAELVVLSTCSPVACPDVHWRFIRGRAVVVACPKLDNKSGYVEKLAAIIRTAHTPKIITVMMAVPCCGGLGQIVAEAIKLSGRSDVCFENKTITLEGIIITS
ncbi:MAG TPA: 4Fe-4S dicluster domain-containing protein [bacterium]|nr:4Fe-4S dicluster domain-containing protein [bacterium]